MFKGAFTKENFKLEYDHPEDFTRCYWQKEERVLPIWVAYRTFVGLYVFTSLVAALGLSEAEGQAWYSNFLYFTYWSYGTECVAFLIALYITVEKCIKERKHPELPRMERMPVSYKILWICYAIAAPCSVSITCMFWFFIYSPVEYPKIGYMLIQNVFSSIFIVLDFSLYAIPYRFLHFYMSFLFCFAFGTFTLVYQLSGAPPPKGGSQILTILNWKKPGLAIAICAVQVMFTMFMHSSFWFFSLSKVLFKQWRVRAAEKNTQIMTGERELTEAETRRDPRRDTLDSF